MVAGIHFCFHSCIIERGWYLTHFETELNFGIGCKLNCNPNRNLDPIFQLNQSRTSIQTGSGLRFEPIELNFPIQAGCKPNNPKQNLICPPLKCVLLLLYFGFFHFNLYLFLFTIIPSRLGYFPFRSIIA